MRRLRRTLRAAILSMIVRRSIERLQARMHRPWMDRVRVAVDDRARIVLPRTLLESPALLALAPRALPSPSSRDRRRLLRGLLLSALAAAAAASLAFAIAAALRARRRSRAIAATTPTAQPVVISVVAPTAAPEAATAIARGQVGESGAVEGVDLPEREGDRVGE